MDSLHNHYTITDNDYKVKVGTNLPNHTMTKQGLGKFVTTGGIGNPLFRTRQAVYRYAAWLIVMAQALPPECECPNGDESFETIRDAIVKVGK